MPIRNGINCVVLDFDGTFTDVHEEARDFPRTYRADVADIAGRDISDAWAEAERAIAKEPDRYGWEFEGKLVAPANADPYLHSNAVAALVFEKMGILKERRLRADVEQVIFKNAYAQTRSVFRPHAKEVLEALMGSGLAVVIVTNSPREIVEKKLGDLGVPPDLRPRVHGEARKFVTGPLPELDPAFDALPESIQVDGLERPIYVRRAHYYRTLTRIWNELRDTSAKTTLVCGDIYELDLALPAQLGAHVHLMTRDGTNPWEIGAVRALGDRGGIGDDLREVLERAGIADCRSAPGSRGAAPRRAAP